MSTDGKEEGYIPLVFEEEETGREKMWRKMKQDPLVPIGSLLTCGALIYASGQLKSGNRETFQRALRWRVIFQTLTVAAAAASLFFFKPPTAQVPPPNADGSPAPMPYWNKEKEERRAAEHDLEWRRRFQDAHARDERENAAVQRMVQEEIEAREKAATAPPEEPPKRVFPKLGQDKRSFTFQQ